MDEKTERLARLVSVAVVVIDLQSLDLCFLVAEHNLGRLELMSVDQPVVDTTTASVEGEVLGYLTQLTHPQMQALGVGVEGTQRIIPCDFHPSIEVFLLEEVSADVDTNEVGFLGKAGLDQFRHLLGRLTFQQLEVVPALFTDVLVLDFVRCGEASELGLQSVSDSASVSTSSGQTILRTGAGVTCWQTEGEDVVTKLGITFVELKH